MLLTSLFFLVPGLLCSAVTITDRDKCNPSTLHLIDVPHDNYFYSDCHSASHVIITTPAADSDLNNVHPRLLVAWPSGNSGIVSLFEPENGQNGTLKISLDGNPKGGFPLQPISEGKRVGIGGSLYFNDSAVLTVPILSSIRAIRDYTEGGGVLHPEIQNANRYQKSGHAGASVSRTWFDNVTTSTLTFTPLTAAKPIAIKGVDKPEIHLGPGSYKFEASFNYPQLKQVTPQQVLNDASSGLIAQNPDQTTSLSFLSYTDKLLAGTWRFLTYFGRDSMVSLLLMQPILRGGQGSAIEAVIGAALERINRQDGSVCHEEVIGDYATFLNIVNNGTASTDPSCDYKMIDTDFFLPIVMEHYLINSETGRGRASDFMNTVASFLPDNKGHSYAELAQISAEKIMRTTAQFASPGGQTKENLIKLKDGQPVGEWRDSNAGLGGGRIPYDVNTALAPAALRSIAALSRAGFFVDHPDWKATADQYASIWEDATLQFFEVSVPKDQASSLVQTYVQQSSFSGPVNTSNITDINFYGLALDGSNNQPIVRVMNTDDCFRLFLLNSTNQTQLSSFLNQTAEHVLQPFPVGLSTDVGLVVANPAYGGDPSYASAFTRSAYHGTVIWGWQLSMMAAGLANQLHRCSDSSPPGNY